jgi:hypothetical protein
MSSPSMSGHGVWHVAFPAGSGGGDSYCMSAFQSKTELGMPMIMMHIMGYGNNVTSHKFFNLNMFLFVRYVDKQFAGADDDEVPSDGNEAMDSYAVRFDDSADNMTTQIYCQLVDYYFRPLAMKDLSLDEFFAKCRKISLKEADKLKAGAPVFTFHELHPQSGTHVICCPKHPKMPYISNHFLPRRGPSPEKHARLALTLLHPWPVPAPLHEDTLFDQPGDKMKKMLAVMNRPGTLDVPAFRQRTETWDAALTRHESKTQREQPEPVGVASAGAQLYLRNVEITAQGLEARLKERRARGAAAYASDQGNVVSGSDHPDANERGHQQDESNVWWSNWLHFIEQMPDQSPQVTLPDHWKVNGIIRATRTHQLYNFNDHKTTIGQRPLIPFPASRCTQALKKQAASYQAFIKQQTIAERQRRAGGGVANNQTDQTEASTR